MGFEDKAKRLANKVAVVQKVLLGQLKQSQAALDLGLSRRQVMRLCKAMREPGASGLVHKLQGRPSNRRESNAEQVRVTAIVKERYSDFGPTLAGQYLRQHHQYLAPDQVIKYLLATPPELMHNASLEERARILTILSHILPISERAAGLRRDSVVGKSLSPSALNSVRASTLIVSLRDDGFSTYASAEYTASQIKGAKFLGFEHGGHVWVGHDDEVMQKITDQIKQVAQ